jgi:hypothetical protein
MRPPKTQSGKIVDVEVVPELCLNFRNCLRIAKGAFIADPATGKTRPALWESVDPELLWQAAWSCPSGAIRVVTQESGYVVPRWNEVAAWDVNRHSAAGQRREESSEQRLDSW